MSRTFRRKGWEATKGNSWSVAGRKVNGYYTTWNNIVKTGNGHEGVKVYVPYTRQEENAEYWRIHGESKHNNAWGPGKDYKVIENRRFRKCSKSELHRELTIPDYEAQFDSNGKYRWDLSYW